MRQFSSCTSLRQDKKLSGSLEAAVHYWQQKQIHMDLMQSGSLCLKYTFFISQTLSQMSPCCTSVRVSKMHRHADACQHKFSWICAIFLLWNPELSKQALFWHDFNFDFNFMFLFIAILAQNSVQSFITQNSDCAKKNTFRSFDLSGISYLSIQVPCNLRLNFHLLSHWHNCEIHTVTCYHWRFFPCVIFNSSLPKNIYIIYNYKGMGTIKNPSSFVY